MKSSNEGVVINETEDILFECPHCGKSLVIDARGIGQVIVCPDCNKEVEVPSWTPSSGEDEVENVDRERVQIEEMLDQLREKINRLEKQQAVDAQCFTRLADEMVLIQAALDRITEIVDVRQSET